MVMTWTAPAALWLLVGVPLVWLAQMAARTNFNPRQRRLQASIRSFLLAAVAVALARPVLTTSSNHQSIVYVVDVSHSVGSRAVEDAARKIDALNDALRPAHFKILAFGATLRAIEGTTELRRLAQLDPAAVAADPIDRSGTDLEAALDAARGELMTGYVPRLVLFTDGQATAGDTAAAVARLAREHIPVSVEPLAVRTLGDTWVDSVELPDRIAAGAAFTATVHVGSQREVTSRVELRSEGRVLARRDVAVPKGTSAVALDAAFDTPGPHIVEAVVSTTGDTLAANNTIDKAGWADPPVRVLYVEGAAGSSRYLSRALGASGFDVQVRPPSALPSTAAALDPWDVVVVSDVPRTAMAPATMAALSEWVEKRGGGLLVAGGESVFGEGGYRNTALERLTPVTFERRDEPEVALILVLDRSWSMAGTSMDLCKAAAQAAVDVMTDEQAIGVLTFNDKFDWDVTLRTVGKNRDAIREKIAAIVPSGPTLIYPALEQAYLALRTAKARAKHVVVLSDGRSLPDDYEGLVQRMAEAHITVSSVAVGPSADRDLLRNIARWGKGRDYLVANAQELPEVFVKEAKNAATPGFDEKEITAIVKAPAFLSGVDVSHLPRLKGRTATVLKDSALEVLATEQDDPLLAFWPIGLGRTAVFASDVKDRWAANWVRWRGYGPFFTSVVRALQRQRTPPMALELVPGPNHRNRRSIAIAIEARDANGRYRDLLSPTVQVRSGESAPATVPVRQVAPGRYEASVVADATKPLTVTTPVSPDSGGRSGGTIPDAAIVRVVLPDRAAEYRFRPLNDDLLKSIASTTGGAWMPTAQALANAAGDRRSERRPVWPWLIVIALCLWFVDLIVRRVRVFEPGTP
jgi:Ca-activated chloride channel family protein